MTTAPETSSINFSNYVTTHCMTCKAGWITQERTRGTGHRLFAQPRTGLARKWRSAASSRRGRHPPHVKYFPPCRENCDRPRGGFQPLAYALSLSRRSRRYPGRGAADDAAPAGGAGAVQLRGGDCRDRRTLRRGDRGRPTLNMPREQIETIIRGLRKQQRDEICGVQNAAQGQGRRTPPKP